MSTITQAHTMAKLLRASLAAQQHEISDSAALELVARQLGFKDWNTASAVLPADDAPAGIAFTKAIPILRIFDEAKAREFYLGFLGFSVEFEHRFEPTLPLYLGIERAGLQFHLSEHHGDASPGSTVYVPMQGIEAYRDELIAKQYGYGRPGIVEQPWGKILEVYDPFGNRIRFSQS